jgi:hypothetical protein
MRLLLHRGRPAPLEAPFRYSQGMNDKSQRVAGIFIAPLVMLTGLWLCLDGLEHGGLSGIFAIGPFVAVAGALWFVSDWF